MEKLQVHEALRQEFVGWRGGAEAKQGVWYACHPDDLASKAFVSVYDLYISKDNSKATAHLRSAYCMIEEIDTHFCPHDLTNYPGHEAMKNKNRSSKNFECPVCYSHLAKMESEGNTYLTCPWCHWESLSIGLAAPDSETLFGLALTREKELANMPGTTSLEDEMAHLVGQLNKQWGEASRQRDKLQRQARGLAYMSGHHHGEAPPLKTIEEVELDWEKRQQALLGGVEPEEPETPSPVRCASPKPQPAPAPRSMTETSRLEQRLRQPQNQARNLGQLEPRRMDLMTKRSKRCPVSNQLIVKPELNPSKASFQKKSDAISKLPRVTVVQSPSRSCLMLRFSNPLETQVTITVNPWEFSGAESGNAAAAETEAQDKPYLFVVEPFTSTIGECFLDPTLTQPLLPNDDVDRVVSRTSNSVIIKFTSSSPVSADFVQARISVTVDGEFFQDLPELKQMKFEFVVNYQCA